MLKVDLAGLEQEEREARAPLPIVIDSTYLDRLERKASELDSLLRRNLRFGRRSELPRVIEWLETDAPSSVLRIRNTLLVKHACANEELSRRAVRAKKFVEAADFLSNAYRSLRRCDFVTVKYLFTHAEWQHQIGLEFHESEWARGLLEHQLEVVSLGLRRNPPTNYDRSRLLEHLFAAAALLVELDHVHENERAEAMASYVAYAWSQTAQDHQAVKLAIVELIKALVYGVAANGLWYLYHMYSTMNPHAMSDIYSKIYEEVSEIVRDRLSANAREALRYGSENFEALQTAGFRHFSR